ncbi:DUF998 domain-containing protein [Arthrobacter agilis]|uniref:DUF998 domain-containing protein n=1 Tax=Arthrobacter agilis TaxID=37921 RepID=UPI0023660A0C|nr:DUF998 domain-containing protein [Arthrobacter agilis]WDF31983.1 DUF998 domain-containing protein [Arthrobacter agilis]
MTTTTDPTPKPATEILLRPRLGAALLILGTVQFSILHTIVQSAWADPTYSWWNNYISDLGAIHCGPILGNDVCSPLHASMNTAFISQGVLLIAGVLLTSNAWFPKSNTGVWRTMVAVTGLSWIVIGLIPEDVNLTGHSIGALPIFILGNIALIVAGVSASTRTRPLVRRTALILGVLGLLGFALTAIAIANPEGIIGIGVAERMTVFPLQIWVLVTGLNILKRPQAPQPAGRTREVQFFTV